MCKLGSVREPWPHVLTPSAALSVSGPCYSAAWRHGSRDHCTGSITVLVHLLLHRNHCHARLTPGTRVNPVSNPCQARVNPASTLHQPRVNPASAPRQPCVNSTSTSWAKLSDKRKRIAPQWRNWNGTEILTQSTRCIDFCWTLLVFSFFNSR